MTTLPISPQDSLLAQTNPGSLNELFNRDPLKLQEADLERMVAYFREKRDQWTLEEKQGKPARTKAAPKATASLADLKALTF